MSDIALSVRNLTKEYRIQHNAERHDRVTEAIAGSVKGIFRKKEVETFRALDDVSFDVKKGEVLGIIGRNGAGKSTLLKILSRITEPTSGEIHLFGRVGSLLEVGTGFHPELTGRENIYLNGSILGMRRREIDRQFDAIVDFAEVEKFLDTPVKRYSSGMYVRLAFAVAAHLNPEILIVDEVLAVGDAQFQKKCLGKMQDISRRDGRTVLFVSHNFLVLQSLCTTGVLLQNGSIEHLGSINEALSSYNRLFEAGSRPDQQINVVRRGTGRNTISQLSINGKDSTETILTGGEFSLQFTLSNPEIRCACIFTIYDEHSIPVANFNSTKSGDNRQLARDSKKVLCRIQQLWLASGRYRINCSLESFEGEIMDHIEGAITFNVVNPKDDLHNPQDTRFGSLVLPHSWVIESNNSQVGQAC